MTYVYLIYFFIHEFDIVLDVSLSYHATQNRQITTRRRTLLRNAANEFVRSTNTTILKIDSMILNDELLLLLLLCFLYFGDVIDVLLVLRFFNVLFHRLCVLQSVSVAYSWCVVSLNLYQIIVFSHSFSYIGCVVVV